MSGSQSKILEASPTKTIRQKCQGQKLIFFVLKLVKTCVKLPASSSGHLCESKSLRLKII